MARRRWPNINDTLSKDELIEFRSFSAFEAKASDILQSDGIIFGTPANFGYMSGALKDFFDRNYYELEGKVEAVHAIFVSASGRYGCGRIHSTNMQAESQSTEPLVLTKNYQSDQNRLRDFGMTMAVGIDLAYFSNLCFCCNRPTYE